MTNKSYAIDMSLLRIGVLAAQIAVSPSTAAHWRDFLVDEGDRLVDLVRSLPGKTSGEIDKGFTASKLIHYRGQ